ncbi:hypothetical protein BCV72DRAFT_255526 [Rhizopus microsporus var. microsporus]|uniref:Uncharacterized protein n=1 Tax=Rhizopus microsporus var. microsporus TaxID=86635 RepID=A0A1X0R7L9_RHIZD|nr:hypothetical protein BCV72DRAFT_255526 [Rhizopus microsporus var. microsporus]
MKDVLMQANVPNIVLETITNRETYLNAKRPEKTSDETLSKKQSRSSEMNLPVKPYNNYNDFTRESFNYQHGIIAQHARDLNIKYRTALRWRHYYEETEEIVYKKSGQNLGPKSSFTAEHNKYINKHLDNDSQLYSDDLIKSLTDRFGGFTFSKAQMNIHLRNIMLITIKSQCSSLKLETQ